MASEIIRFSTKEEYLQWLQHRSGYVQEKAKEFHRRYGDDTIPVILSLDGDTFCEQGGCHVFLHPDHADFILRYIIF